MRTIDYSSTPLNPTINKELDRVLPIDPLTGLRGDLVHKYEIALTDSERSNLERYLQVQEISQPEKQLSDKDLIALCPSRFVQTLSDVKELANAMRDVVADLDKGDQSADIASSAADLSSSTAPSA